MQLCELDCDVLRLILEDLPDAVLYCCLTTSKSMFLIVVPILWSRERAPAFEHQKVRDLVDAADPPESGTMCWRVAQYLHANAELRIEAQPLPVEPAQLLRWLGTIDIVHLSFPGAGAEATALVQRWVQAVIDLLRRGRGPRVVHIGAGYRNEDLVEILSIRTLTAVHLWSESDHEVADHLRHDVGELTASILFLRKYAHTDSIKRLKVTYHNQASDIDNHVWRFSALTDLALDVRHAGQGDVASLLTATLAKLMRLEIACTALKVADVELIARLRALVILDLDLCDGDSNLEPLSALPHLRELKLTVQQLHREWAKALHSVEDMVMKMSKLHVLDFSVSDDFHLHLPCRRFTRLKLVNVTAFMVESLESEGWPLLEELVLESAAVTWYEEADWVENTEYIYNMVGLGLREFSQTQSILDATSGNLGVLGGMVPKPRILVDGKRVVF
ncbi:hypothetical protein HK101_010524 [Irineochytrium annulatum]|nr:hypothetical protein HK101_010524 [Irineochytrium annulatum]